MKLKTLLNTNVATRYEVVVPNWKGFEFYTFYIDYCDWDKERLNKDYHTHIYLDSKVWLPDEVLNMKVKYIDVIGGRLSISLQ